MTAALAELDRWADDGGPPNDGGPGFPPLTITLTADASRFWAEMARALSRASEALALFGEAFRGAFASERPVVRARRLRVERAMRARARRAARKGRVLR